MLVMEKEIEGPIASLGKVLAQSLIEIFIQESKWLLGL
jgi:hypothetical protein